MGFFSEFRKRRTEFVIDDGDWSKENTGGEEDEAEKGDGNNSLVIILGVLAGVLTLIILGLVIYICIRAKKKKTSKTKSDDLHVFNFTEDKPLSLSHAESTQMGTLGFTPTGVDLKKSKKNKRNTISRDISHDVSATQSLADQKAPIELQKSEAKSSTVKSELKSSNLKSKVPSTIGHNKKRNRDKSSRIKSSAPKSKSPSTVSKASSNVSQNK